MINYSSNRNKFIVSPTVPSGTEVINYEVVVGGVTVFVGRCPYYGGNFEVDCEDFMDAYIANAGNTVVTSVSVTVNFTFDDASAVTTIVCSWTPGTIYLEEPYATEPFVYLNLGNCGFLLPDNITVKVPLSHKNGLLDGKTTNKLDKVTYMDRYGDTHNGSMSNHYEIECYVDPCWFQVKTNGDFEYEKVMLALQNAQSTYLYGSGVGISGMYIDTTQSFLMECRVKDIEQIETYSSYSTDKKVPSYKIVLEVYK